MKAGRIPIVVGSELRRGDRTLVFDLDLQNSFDQQRTLDLLVQQLLRAMKLALQERVEFVRCCELLAEVCLGAAALCAAGTVIFRRNAS